MPGQRGNPRDFVGLRMHRDGLEAVDRLAVDEKVTTVRPDADGELEEAANRSEMIRLLIARGLATWQRGWRPKGWEPSS